jgi:hypothetical protein
MPVPSEQIVRNRVTPDTDPVSGITDQEVLDLLSANDGDVDLATADALEVLAARRPFKAITRGQVREELIDPVARAALYRRRAELAAVQAGQAQKIDQATLSRSDLGVDLETEYSFG